MTATRGSYDPRRHHRRSIRLRGYDYTLPGEYFVTICVQQRACLLGEITADEMVSNGAGDMVASWWRALPRKFPSCQVDAFVVMPNHVHGIVVIRAASPVAVSVGERTHAGPGGHAGPPLQADRGVTLGRIVQWFKTMTTNAYIRGVDERAWTPFAGRLWQRNYYEHIVRDEDELNRVRDYIADNPRSWKDDPDNPAIARA